MHDLQSQILQGTILYVLRQYVVYGYVCESTDINRAANLLNSNLTPFEVIAQVTALGPFGFIFHNGLSPFCHIQISI